jgi:steroid delta-isomerase-like uncharacterized protein
MSDFKIVLGIVTGMSLVIMASIFGCVSSDQEQLELNKNLTKQFAEALNTANWDMFDILLAEDFLRHSQATTDMQVTSRDDMKQLMQLYQEFAPDQKLTIDFIIAKGNMVAGYGTYSGTNTGPLGELPATGKPFELKNINIFQIVNGRIAEQWVEWDNMAILTQLGLFPTPSQYGKIIRD